MSLELMEPMVPAPRVGAGQIRRKVLMVAYHFPPLAGSSGIQRTLRFVQHLPSLGWDPIVLTVQPHAYERTSADLDREVPAGTVVERAFALDTSRHLAIGGRYPGWLARPDRWMTWRLHGVRRGMDLIRRHRPDAIFSTYPIATAHVIGEALHRASGLPWLADFRDPMAQEGYPEDPATWRAFEAIERRTITSASASIFTTPSAARTYRARYPDAAGRIHLLENGYDEDTFARAEAAVAPGPLVPGATTLLHSGIVYPSERDPTQLMAALALLARSDHLQPAMLRVRFRAAVAEDLVRRLAAEHGVTEFVEICPPVPYKDALEEMLRADGLLVMQASNCNEQVPAKLYEYFRARRPILGLTDPLGDTATVIRDAGIDAVARLDDAPAIAGLIARFLGRVQGADQGFVAQTPYVQAASRERRSAELAALLASVAEARR